MAQRQDSKADAPDPLVALRVRQNAILAGLTAEQVDVFAAIGRRRTITPGERIWSQGETSDAACLLLAGRIEVSRTTPDGYRSVFRILDPPALVGLSVVAGNPHTADLDVSRPGSIAQFSGSDLRNFFQQHPEAAFAALAYMGQLLGDITTEFEDYRTLPLTLRLWKTLSRLRPDGGEIRITQARLAELVGATRPKVTAALNTLVGQGHLVQSRGAVTVIHQFPSIN